MATTSAHEMERASATRKVQSSYGASSDLFNSVNASVNPATTGGGENKINMAPITKHSRFTSYLAIMAFCSKL